MYRHSRIPPPPARQRGATLVIALLILVLIMMIGITAVSTSNTQYKLAGNLQFEDVAINNAEVAIAAAESWLSTDPNHVDPGFTAAGPNPDPAKPRILPRTADPTVRATRDRLAFNLNWSDAAAADLFSATVAGNTSQRYYIELMSVNNRLQGSSAGQGSRTSVGCNQVNTFLITGRGASARGATKLVQSYYAVLSCPT